MENVKQMRERHAQEIETLQSNCLHPTSKRMPYMWAPGHFGNDVSVCVFCGKILAHYEGPFDSKEGKAQVKKAMESLKNHKNLT